MNCIQRIKCFFGRHVACDVLYIGESRAFRNHKRFQVTRFKYRRWHQHCAHCDKRLSTKSPYRKNPNLKMLHRLEETDALVEKFRKTVTGR